MRFVILVPWRPSDDRRRLLWDWTRPYLEEFGPVFTGDSDGPWSRASACNRASKEAGQWDVALVADSDTIPEPGSIERAVAWVESTGGAARPHLDRYILNPQGTLRFGQLGLEGLRPEDIDHSWPGGGLLVLTREAFETVGGYDESFVGWGYEDTAMTLALLRHSRWDRLPGKAWHLWHQPGRASMRTRQKAQELYAEYAAEIEALGSNQRGMTLLRETV